MSGTVHGEASHTENKDVRSPILSLPTCSVPIEFWPLCRTARQTLASEGTDGGSPEDCLRPNEPGSICFTASRNTARQGGSGVPREEMRRANEDPRGHDGKGVVGRGEGVVLVFIIVASVLFFFPSPVPKSRRLQLFSSFYSPSFPRRKHRAALASVNGTGCSKPLRES